MLRSLVLVLTLTIPWAAQAQEARRATATRDGAVLEYLDRGSGPAIVTIASLGRGAEDFNDLSRRLATQGYRVICPEPRGISRSTPAPADASLGDFAADVAAVIERAGVAPVVALGHAYGNTVARTLATTRPDLVRGVILVAASGRAPLSDAIKRAIANASNPTIPDAERLRDLAAGYFAPGNDPFVWLAGWYPATQAVQMQAYLKSKAGDYVTAGGTMPILEIQGAEDVIIPSQYSKDLQNELGPRVTLVVIPQAGHAMLPEQPVALASAIAEWMKRFGREPQ